MCVCVCVVCVSGGGGGGGGVEKERFCLLHKNFRKIIGKQTSRLFFLDNSLLLKSPPINERPRKTL